jgi:hypothetical protein
VEEVNSDSLGSTSPVARIHMLSVATSFLLISCLDFDSHRTTRLVEIDRPGVLHDSCLVRFNVSSLVSCSGRIDSVSEEDFSSHLDGQLNSLLVTLSHLQSIECFLRRTDFFNVLVPAVGPHLGNEVSEIGDEH